MIAVALLNGADAESSEELALRRPAFVALVQATELRNRHDLAVARQCDRPRDGRIFAEGQVSPGFQIVLDVGVQHATQPALIPDDDVIKAFAANRSEQALRVGVLPR